jgi:hypothetical protein
MAGEKRTKFCTLGFQVTIDPPQDQLLLPESCSDDDNDSDRSPFVDDIKDLCWVHYVLDLRVIFAQPYGMRFHPGTAAVEFLNCKFMEWDVTPVTPSIGQVKLMGRGRFAVCHSITESPATIFKANLSAALSVLNRYAGVATLLSVVYEVV